MATGAGFIGLWTGKEEYRILRRVVQARTGWSRQIQDVGVAGGIDEVDIPAIAAGQVGTGTVASGRHHNAEARSSRGLCRRAKGVVGRKSRDRKITLDGVARGVDHRYLRAEVIGCIFVVSPHISAAAIRQSC